jgi:hypothetical protein
VIRRFLPLLLRRDRLAKIERLPAVSLDDPDIRVSLHVTLKAPGQHRAHA